MSWNVLLLCVASFVLTAAFGLEPRSPPTDSPSQDATSEPAIKPADDPPRPARRS